MSEPRTFLREVARRIWGDGWPGDYEAVTFEALERRPRFDGFIEGYLDSRAKAVDELYQVRIGELLAYNTELVLKHREEKAALVAELEKATHAWEGWQAAGKRFEETAALATALTMKERLAHVEDRKNDWLTTRRVFRLVSHFLEDSKPYIEANEKMLIQRAAVANAINEWGREMDAFYNVTIEDVAKEDGNGTS